MTTFKNCTPHAIHLNDGTVFPTTGIVARVTASFSEATNGICEQVFGMVEELPVSEENTLFIVSAMVLEAAKREGRMDCVAPATGHPLVVRNEKGHIVSVPCFVR
jgi:hypothetical protein